MNWIVVICPTQSGKRKSKAEIEIYNVRTGESLSVFVWNEYAQDAAKDIRNLLSSHAPGSFAFEKNLSHIELAFGY